MARRYGRGKYDAHSNYIEYMKAIVEHPNYADMPNAVQDGHINWQVSSGKTTSFYKYYKARWAWWAKKADSLKLTGSGNSDSRFSTAARIIHPDRLRPCRLCGKKLNVGYMYLNKIIVKRWNNLVGADKFIHKQDIRKACQQLGELTNEEMLQNEIAHLFPERLKRFGKPENIVLFFEESFYIRSNYLSPGFMSNPPDRLDGFHDYGLCCRKTKDPGRSDENLRSYNHDRRTFKWWAEGDWLVADTLYNAAGEGVCVLCGRKEKKISPDHIGPLACGFKQIPSFRPTCRNCNSAKNRRMSLIDIKDLIQYEKNFKESVASWHVRSLWDLAKNNVTNDADARELSSAMRGIEDIFLRTLFTFCEIQRYLFISYYLSPHLAHFNVEFEGLDVATLKSDKYKKTAKRTTGSISLESRVVRIAFEELENYVSKEACSRKIFKKAFPNLEKKLSTKINAVSKEQLNVFEKLWVKTFRMKTSNEHREKYIGKLLGDDRYDRTGPKYEGLDRWLKKYFDRLGSLVYKELKSPE